MAEEEETSRRAKEFHARSAKTVYEPPFVPEPSHRGPIVPESIRLNSEIRAEKRQEFDDMLNEKELEVAEEQYQRKLENEEKEREEVGTVLDCFFCLFACDTSSTFERHFNTLLRKKRLSSMFTSS